MRTLQPNKPPVVVASQWGIPRKVWHEALVGARPHRGYCRPVQAYLLYHCALKILRTRQVHATALPRRARHPAAALGASLQCGVSGATATRGIDALSMADTAVSAAHPRTQRATGSPRPPPWDPAGVATTASLAQPLNGRKVLRDSGPLLAASRAQADRGVSAAVGADSDALPGDGSRGMGGGTTAGDTFSRVSDLESGCVGVWVSGTCKPGRNRRWPGACVAVEILSRQANRGVAALAATHRPRASRLADCPACHAQRRRA